MAIQSAADTILQALDPRDYPSATLDDECATSPAADTCNDRLAGFSAAKYYSKGLTCWEGPKDFARFKSKAFQQGYLDWWTFYHADDEKCVQPPRPARCRTAFCTGGRDGYKFGFGFRPSIQVGATRGKGVGFSEGEFSTQFSGAIGGRLFLYDDAVDLHLALGIATSTASGDTGTTASKQNSGFLVSQFGIGAYRGLFCISMLHTFDPFSDAGTGNGISIYVDAAAVDRIVDH